MTMEPLMAAFLGGWEIVLILTVVGALVLTVAVSVIVIAVVLTKRERANKRVPSGAQLPPFALGSWQR